MSVSDSTFHDQKYRKYFKKYGANPKSLLWGSYKSAAIRYKELVDNLDIENKTILDVGCGMGDLMPYLFAKTSNFNYLGVDINEEFINIAKDRYLGQKFKVANPFDGNFKARYDIVLCSGVMNANVPDWPIQRQKMITKLFGLTKDCLVFNMAGGQGRYTNTSLIAYANAEEIKAFCLILTPKVALKADYHPKDFTITMLK